MIEVHVTNTHNMQEVYFLNERQFKSRTSDRIN
jgi:hypothetical protein